MKFSIFLSRNFWHMAEISMTEISAICQKFLVQNMQILIPHPFCIHHISPWAAEMVKINNFGVKWQKFLPCARNFQIWISRISFRIFSILVVIAFWHDLSPKYGILRFLPSGAEISAVCQKFLGQNVQILVPHLSYVHHFPLWATEIAKKKNFGENDRNFCHMPEISRSKYPEKNLGYMLPSSFLSIIKR